MMWADQVGGIWFLVRLQLQLGRVSFSWIPPVDGLAGLVLFLGAGQLDDPPWTPIPLHRFPMTKYE